jgi:CheY-like chemotaxis protein
MADPSQVETAILNLCLNARDALPEGGSVLISTSNFDCLAQAAGPAGNHLQPGDYVRICVADSGVGMTADVKARAFDPFFSTKGVAGSGLGLSQVYGMARQSGGDVTIDSAPGEGTRVTLYLPRASEADDQEAAAGDVLTRSSPSENVLELILVVDDDSDVRQVTVEMVRDLGCGVAQAGGGNEALTLLETLRPKPDLALLDYAMPGMNGLQLAGEMRRRGLTMPVALVTGYAEVAEADIVANHLAAVLHKPFTILELHGLLVQLRRVAATEATDACFEPGLTGG